jgi:hypothetical protein
MTIIAATNTLMIADGARFNGCIKQRMPEGKGKIIRAPDGSLVGMAGTMTWTEQLRRWVDIGMLWSEKPVFQPNANDDNTMAWLWLQTNGTLWFGDQRMEPYEVTAPSAIGMEIAAAVVESLIIAGVDPIRAMNLTIERHTYTGGPLQIVYLNQ